jgi:hypothetical protein
MLVLAVAAAGFAMGLAGPAPKPAHGAVPWPVPANPLRLAVAAGLKPERHETLIHHVHSHLDVFVNGKPIRVPAGIGINIHDCECVVVPSGAVVRLVSVLFSRDSILE